MIKGVNAFHQKTALTGSINLLPLFIEDCSFDPNSHAFDDIKCLILEGVLEFAGVDTENHPLLAVKMAAISSPPFDFEISERAFNHAFWSPNLSPQETYTKLYRYGLRPITASCPVLQALDEIERQVTDSLLSAFKTVDQGPYWKVFKNRQATDWKIYLSVERANIVPLLPAISQTLRNDEASAMKMAFSPQGLSRPDNIMIYFPSKRSAQKFSTTLSKQINFDDIFPLPFSLRAIKDSHIGLGTETIQPKLRSPTLTGGSWRSNICQILTRAIANMAREDKEFSLNYGLYLLAAHRYSYSNEIAHRHD